MIGIYKPEFIEYLKENLNISNLKTTSKNIIVPCPWCEYDQKKDHYHLYISLHAPIFNCFHAGCGKSGFITKIVNKIQGTKSSSIERYVDKSKIEIIKLDKALKQTEKKRNIILPKIEPDQFLNKILFLKKRFKFSQSISVENIPGLVLDFYKFLEINNIVIDEYNQFSKMKDFIQNNFVGFVTNNKSYIIFRNIDLSSEFAHTKFPIGEDEFLDYYKINGNKNGKYVLLAEGVFDIYSEYIFNFLKKKNDIFLYACSASSNFQNLMKSIIFNEQIFKLDLLILADRGIPIDYYKKIKYYNKHIINSIGVYYNKTGKDFNEFPVTVDEFIF